MARAWLYCAIGVALSACSGGDASDAKSDALKEVAVAACRNALETDSFPGMTSRGSDVTDISGGYHVKISRELQTGQSCPAIFEGECDVRGGVANITEKFDQRGYEAC